MYRFVNSFVYKIIFFFYFQQRKFDQYIFDGIFTTSSELISRQKYDIKNVKDVRKSPSSPLSCSTLSEMCIEEYSQLSDSEDSIKGPSYPINQGSLKIQPRDLMASSRISLSSTYEDLEFAFPNKKFLPSMGNHLPRLVIPIGPRFQAKVPKWEGVTNILVMMV